MAFTKIRETIAAFKPTRTPSFDEQRREQHRRQRRPQSDDVSGIERSRWALGVVSLLVVALPASFILNWVLNHVIHVQNSQTVGVISVLVIYGIGVLHANLVNKVIESVPTRELSYHFGSKLDETFAAFRRERDSSYKSSKSPVRTAR